MTQEEKAKAYDEAIERVVNIRTGKCETTFIFTEGLFNYLFPELEECNDEEVRKAMIDFFKHEREEGVVVSHYGVNIERMIAWLEKQGNPTDINPSEFDLRINKLLKQFETLPKEELASSLSFYLNVVQNDGTYREEKQGEQNLIMAKSPQLGEQKPADKVEPKFKIGDVVCDKSCTTLDKNVQPNYEIVDIKNGMYFCNEGVIPIEHQDQFELVAKKIEPKFHEKNWSADDYLWQITCKEQCDLLYTKIKEAGYEWDDEKKEFKKIKNPAWSEKDEAVVKDICDKLSWLRVIYTGNQNIACQKDIYWLKSLKGRVGCEANFTTMWKPSEKQIMCLQDALSDYHRRGYKAETLETLLKQLKQL